MYWSDETYRLFGLLPGALIPRYSDFLRFVHPGDQDRVERAVQDCLAQGRYNPEFRIIRMGGEERYFQITGKTTLDKDGNLSKMEGYVQDITE